MLKGVQQGWTAGREVSLQRSDAGLSSSSALVCAGALAVLAAAGLRPPKAVRSWPMRCCAGLTLLFALTSPVTPLFASSCRPAHLSYQSIPVRAVVCLLCVPPPACAAPKQVSL